MDEPNVPTSPRVLAVVVTHNGEAWLGECLRSLAGQVHPALDVVVVDNGSRSSAEPTVRWVTPRAEFLRLERNIGFGAAANRALAASSAAPRADYFLFLHDDVALDPECVSLLVAAASETGAGVVGGKAVDWQEPHVLIEVGMGADQFGYPLSGLEKGEIDQGQHDARREVLFVTSACTLASRALVERCGSWDGAYFAYGEDLDLCLRARVAGFVVVVQPAARLRHAAALATLQREAAPARMVRFLTRRNRLRTIVKNVAAPRLPLVVTGYLMLLVAEVIALVALRRFDELPSYPRALASFGATLPDVLRRRRAVQKRRVVPDRRIRPLVVRDVFRARVFLERRLAEWGHEAVPLGTRGLARLSPPALRAALGGWLRRPGTLVGILLTLVLLLAGRDFVLGGPVAAGGLWPFPAPISRLASAYFSSWRDVGLGSASAAPPALLLLWPVGLLALGSPVLAQKLLVAILIVIGVAGMSRLTARRARFPAARLAAAAVYVLAPALSIALGRGDLAALALFAGLPFLFDLGSRVMSEEAQETSPSMDLLPSPARARPVATARDLFRFALVAALVCALAPSAFPLLVVLWLLAGIRCLGPRGAAGLPGGAPGAAFGGPLGAAPGGAAAGAPGRKALVNGWVRLGVGLALALLLLIPWSLEALRPGGAILAPLFAGVGGGTAYGPLWARESFRTMVLAGGSGLLPSIAALVIALGSTLLPSAPRRGEARRLAIVWLSFAVLGGIVAAGWAPPPAASPVMLFVIGAAAVAALMGHLVAGIQEELPRRGLGWRHAAAVVSLVAVASVALVSWLPSLWGVRRPAATLAADTGEQLAAALSSYFQSSAQQRSGFRVLWLGRAWVDPVRAAARPAEVPYLLTGPGGLTMLDGLSFFSSPGQRRLDDIVTSLAGMRIHLAGHLLATASVRFIVVDPGDAALMRALARQRDIALRQQEERVAIFENLQWLPRAVLAPPALDGSATGGGDPQELLLTDWKGGRPIPPASSGFAGDVPRTRHPVLLLADNYSGGWEASIGGKELSHGRAFGWANRFRVPATALGEIRLRYRGRLMRAFWLAVQAGVVAVALSAAAPNPRSRSQ